MNDFAQCFLHLDGALARILDCKLSRVIVHEVDPAANENDKLERAGLFLRTNDA